MESEGTLVLKIQEDIETAKLLFHLPWARAFDRNVATTPYKGNRQNLTDAAKVTDRLPHDDSF